MILWTGVTELLKPEGNTQIDVRIAEVRSDSRVLLLEATELVMDGLKCMRLQETAAMATGGVGCACEACLSLVECALRFASERR